MFLNNNYHAVHHDLPHVPWYALRDVYETYRQQYLERSGGFLVRGYSEWLRFYAFAPVAHPAHGDLTNVSVDWTNRLEGLGYAGNLPGSPDKPAFQIRRSQNSG